MRTRNTLYKELDWQPCDRGEGLTVTLDVDVYRLSDLLIVPIDEWEQQIIDRYDAARYQEDSDTVVFYAAWADGEWQPRATYPDYDTAKSAIDQWFLGYTEELSERRSNDG